MMRVYSERVYKDPRKQWHRWFAWFPVRVSKTQIAWLEYVERVFVPWLSEDGGFEYREIKQEQPEENHADPVASAYVRRIRNECDGLVEYLHSRGDQISSDKGDRVAARIYKPLRQVDGIINGFGE